MTTSDPTVLDGAYRMLSIAEDETQGTIEQRYSRAYMAALGGVVQVMRLRPMDGGYEFGIWSQLMARAPELEDYAVYYAACSGRRDACEAGLVGAVSPDDTKHILVETRKFLDTIAEMT